MNLSELAGRPVLDLAAATNVGKIADFAIDPVTRRIVGFHLANVKGPAYWLSWEAMNTLGADAVTIDRHDVLTEPPQHARRLRTDKIIGGRVLTDAGRELANLVDLDIEPETGQITALTIGDHSIPADALIGIGRYATVVTDPHT